MKIVIAFCSPAGSTRHVAQLIHNSFNQRNVDAVMLDLAKDHNRSEALDVIKTADQKVCLISGSYPGARQNHQRATTHADFSIAQSNSVMSQM